MKIIGAGLAGLLAAHAWPRAEVIESEPEPRAIHKALLRFRSRAVSDLTGIDFRSVTVRKGVWSEGAFHPIDIRLANIYAQKVAGALVGDRSIWALEPVQRYIAPEDFYEQLIAAVAPRIRWSEAFDFAARKPTDEPIISTAPLPVVTGEYAGFKRLPIHVARYRVAGADTYQTVYFPDHDRDELSVYRASITGSLLIVEAVQSKHCGAEPGWSGLGHVCAAFGIAASDLTELGQSSQRYGKIIPLPDEQRKKILHVLTVERNIYSLGRFATWRNILLDDVVQDIAVIRRMMRVSEYDLKKFAS